MIMFVGSHLSGSQHSSHLMPSCQWIIHLYPIPWMAVNSICCIPSRCICHLCWSLDMVKHTNSSMLWQFHLASVWLKRWSQIYVNILYCAIFKLFWRNSCRLFFYPSSSIPRINMDCVPPWQYILLVELVLEHLLFSPQHLIMSLWQFAVWFLWITSHWLTVWRAL